MERYKITIVEDEPTIACSLKEIIECLDYDVAGVAESAEEALSILKTEEVDLLLLDIRLKGKIDGVALAEQIKNTHDLPFIFTTAYADSKTLNKAKELGPYGYIVKPYGIKDIYTAIEIAMSNYHQLKELEKINNKTGVFKNEYLYVKTDTRLVKLNSSEVLYVEARGDYAIFKTKDKSYIVHSTMKNIEQKMWPSNFLKVHRSFIVNLDKIVDIEDSNLLISDRIIPISRANKQALMNRINLI